ncbi:hypothetical protein [Salisediminibacterium beveridgei]|uniref:Uncharacterized protein n=1 Tax=Salisediminibacterium beveridgei TaxID=632773 RepID=A0A1D7QY47_9BACI|nr:hypothetical protein [Salisediminibacterium beveridgei]AOM83936.1 hypothetical protein BBEV_2597 [Salisediminibacterium beveridgei]
MTVNAILTSLFMCSADDACEVSLEKDPEFIVDLRAEADVPVSGAMSRFGTKSFALVNGGPTSPEELKRAIVFVSGQLEYGNRVVLH